MQVHLNNMCIRTISHLIDAELSNLKPLWGVNGIAGGYYNRTASIYKQIALEDYTNDGLEIVLYYWCSSFS